MGISSSTMLTTADQLVAVYFFLLENARDTEQEENAHVYMDVVYRDSLFSDNFF